VDGEVFVIEDTVVCKFDGFEHISIGGKYRQWETTLKSGDEYIALLDLRPLEEINEFGQTMLELYFYYGNAAYYMGDKGDSMARSAQDFNYISYRYQAVDGGIGHSSYLDYKAYEKYKIRLISFEVAAPIENSFG